jgi:hypothetical protein
MSVFSLDTSHGNPVTEETVDKLCSQLGVTIKDDEKEDYRRLLAVFHDASEQLMAIDGKHSCAGSHLDKDNTTNQGRLCSSSRRRTLFTGEHSFPREGSKYTRCLGMEMRYRRRTSQGRQALWQDLRVER